jgi:exodeoxyribonuclease VII large subunit
MHAAEKNLGETRIWPVTALLNAMADALSARFNPVAVQGEISGFVRAASGHCYFSLKDAQSQLRCAMFRRAASLCDFTPRDGDVVAVRGRLDVYNARGELQLIVESMQRAGEGALMAQFQALKARLAALGWFDAQRKQAIPARPRHVAVITSLQAAALRDVASTLQRRAPHVAVTLYPASVQGERAVPELLDALAQVAQSAQSGHPRGPIDTLLLVRGGGSLEDLWAFNDPQLAQALVDMPVPVICGVGHETDFTIADFVADLRAPTPTAAAEMAAMPWADDVQWLQRLQQDLQASAQRALQQRSQSLDHLSQLISRPGRQIATQQQRLQQVRNQLQQAMARAQHQAQQRVMGAAWRLHQGQSQRLAPAREALALQQRALRDAAREAAQRRRDRLSQAQARLEALSPQHTLARGYAWLAHPDGRVVQSVAQAQSGDELRARLADGELDLRVR